MPPMDRNTQNQCIKKNGRPAAHHLCDPPRTEGWSFRTTAIRYDRFEIMIATGGYTCRADAVDDAVQLLASLLRQEPLPAWLAVGNINPVLPQET